MASIDPSRWKFSPERVGRALAIVDKQMIASEPIEVYIPYRYIGKKLAMIAEKFTTVAIFGIKTEDDFYCAHIIPGYLTLEGDIESAVVNGDEFMIIRYEKGDLIVDDVTIVAKSSIAFLIYEGFYGAGYCPWFLNYDNYSRLLALAKDYADIDLSPTNVSIEMTVASMSKFSGDQTQQFRSKLGIKFDIDKDQKDAATVPLENIIFGTTNFTSRFNGAYLNHGILASLTSPSTKPERLEEILRL